MELYNCKFSWFWNIIWTIYEILFVMLEILQTAKRLAACQRRLKLRIRALRLPEGLSLAGPSVDMSQQHFDHFSDKIN